MEKEFLKKRKRKEENEITEFNEEKVILEIKNSQDFSDINIISIFPSGKILFVLMDIILILDEDFKCELQKIEDAHDSIILIDLIINETTFISGSSDVIKIWKKSKEIFLCKGIIPNNEWINDIIYSLNGEIIFSGNTYSNIKFFEEIQPMKYQCKTIINFSCSILSMLLLEDKQLLITSGNDGTDIWNFINLEHVGILNFCSVQSRCIKRLDEDKIIIYDNDLIIFNISKKNIVNIIKNENDDLYVDLIIFKELDCILTISNDFIEFFTTENNQSFLKLDINYNNKNNDDEQFFGIIKYKNDSIIIYSNSIFKIIKFNIEVLMKYTSYIRNLIK